MSDQWVTSDLVSAKWSWGEQLNRDLNNVVGCADIRGRAFQAERTARAKALRCKWA